MAYNFDMENEEQTLSKLYKVFKDGYRPSRLKQSYCRTIKMNDGSIIKPLKILNCVAHAFFNPTNQVLRDYGFSHEDAVFGNFNPFKGPFSTFSEILHFVKDAGLKVEECSRKKQINQFGSWKVDAYFRMLFTNPDYHFMLQESRGIYSHKQGFDGDVAILCSAPKEYNNYQYCTSFLITNIHADENNKYNKPLLEHEAERILF